MRLALLASMSFAAAGAMSPGRLAAQCGPASAGAGSLDGRAVDDAYRPVAFALVTVSWRAPQDTALMPRASDGRFTTTDADGQWSLCKVPFGTMVLRSNNLGLSDETIAVLDSAHPHDVVNLLLQRHEARGAARQANVAITVTNREGVPIDASIELKTADGVRRLTATDGRSFVALSDPQRIEVTARAIGYEPGTVAVGVDRGSNTIPLIMDPIAVPLLAALRVIGDREVSARHSAFEERRRLGSATLSITAAEIEKRNPVDVWQMLTGVPSMKILPYGSAMYAISSRGDRLTPDLRMVSCFYRVMVDGIVMAEAMPDLSHLPPPKDVHGIEVFAGPGSIPPQYNSTIGGSGGQSGKSCGLIAIWTK